MYNHVNPPKNDWVMIAMRLMVIAIGVVVGAIVYLQLS